MATVSPPWSYTLQLPRDPRSPGIGRVTLRSVLAARGFAGAIPAAELVASELLTNAQQHTKGPYALRIVHLGEPDRFRVAVWDTDPRVPAGFTGDGATVVVPPADDDECGRGLQLVRACADSLGVSVLRELGASKGGKLLWAECQWGGLR